MFLKRDGVRSTCPTKATWGRLSSSSESNRRRVEFLLLRTRNCALVASRASPFVLTPRSQTLVLGTTPAKTKMRRSTSSSVSWQRRTMGYSYWLHDVANDIRNLFGVTFFSPWRCTMSRHLYEVLNLRMSSAKASLPPSSPLSATGDLVRARVSATSGGVGCAATGTTPGGIHGDMPGCIIPGGIMPGCIGIMPGCIMPGCIMPGCIMPGCIMPAPNIAGCHIAAEEGRKSNRLCLRSGAVGLEPDRFDILCLNQNCTGDHI